MNYHTSKTPLSSCPSCGKKMDAATCSDKKDQTPPQPGDISICFDCQEILEFNNELILVKADLDKLDNEMIQYLDKLIKSMKRFKKKPINEQPKDN